MMDNVFRFLQFFESAREIWEETRDKKINFILVSPMDNSFHESTGKQIFYYLNACIYI